MFLLWLAVTLLRFDVDKLVGVSQPPQPTTTADNSPVELTDEFDQDWQRFDQAFTGEAVYRDAELSVSSLARQLKIPEYRLRKLIVQKLG